MSVTEPPPNLVLPIFTRTGAVENKEVLKTQEDIQTDTELIMSIANYSDFLTRQEMLYLRDIIRAYRHPKQDVEHETYINIMRKLELLAEHKYKLGSAIIRGLKTTNNIYDIHVMIDRHIKLKLVESAEYSAIFTPEQLSILKELDTYTFGIELRKALLEHSDFGLQLPVNIRNYLETIDPYIVLAFIDKLLSSSSEGIDIVIQPICNIFGFLHNGDLHPLYKMVIELMLIGELTNDDKSKKRQIRLNFLSACIEIPDFLKLYYSMYLYLNCIQKGQTIALIVSGGNLVTLFAKLLNDICIKSSFELLIDEHKDILTELLHYYPHFDEETLLLHLKRQVTPILAESIPTVAAMLFGDLDYKLIKLKINKDYRFTSIKQLYDDFRTAEAQARVVKNAQFFLGRKKIIKYKGKFDSEKRNQLRIYRKQYEEWLKYSCYEVVDIHGNGEVLKTKLDREILDNIFPSQMQDHYLELLKELKKPLDDPYKIIPIDNCIKYLLFLSSRKAMNELGTRENINKISGNGDTSQFIQALRYYTRTGNTFILGVKRINRVGDFTTFDYVMTHNSGLLPKLVASLLNLFITDTGIHPDFVMGYQPRELEASKVTYDYSKSMNSKSYEAIMVACKAIITLRNSRGYHVVFLGLDEKNKKAPNLSNKKPGIPLVKTIKKKLASYMSTKTYHDYVSSLVVNIDEPDDSEFSDNYVLPENFYDIDNQFLYTNAVFFSQFLLPDIEFTQPNFEAGDGEMSLFDEHDAGGDMAAEAPPTGEMVYERNYDPAESSMIAGGFNNNLVKSRKHKSKKPKKSRKSKPQKSRKHKPKKPQKSRKYKPKKSRKLRY
jgi:hypothetical protein